MDLRSPSSAPTSYLRSHEQNDLMRQVDSLQSALAARDTEVARLRQLTDKGALQVGVFSLLSSPRPLVPISFCFLLLFFDHRKKCKSFRILSPSCE
jgi:hypothetical protein